MEDEEYNTYTSSQQSDSPSSGDQQDSSQSGDKQDTQPSGYQQSSNTDASQQTKDSNQLGKIELQEPKNAEEILKKFRKKKKRELIKDILLLIILIEILVLTTVFAKARVHGVSMEPTLKEGQVVTCQKYGYTINRGDIVVVDVDKLIQISDPNNTDAPEYFKGQQCLVKRVVGLPGDIMEYKDKALYINHELVCANEKTDVANLFGDYNITKEETLAGKTEIVIPENKYYLVGDNYNESIDSRYYGWFDRSEITMKVIKK